MDGFDSILSQIRHLYYDYSNKTVLDTTHSLRIDQVDFSVDSKTSTGIYSWSVKIIQFYLLLKCWLRRVSKRIFVISNASKSC